MDAPLAPADLTRGGGRLGRALGTCLIATAVVTTAVVQPMADLNRTHAFNEEWPAHARFHNLASLGMLEICCATALYLLFTRRGDPRLNTTIAAIAPASFWGPFFPAGLVPGASFGERDDHLLNPDLPHVGRFNVYPNASLAAGELVLAGLGLWRFLRSSRTA